VIKGEWGLDKANHEKGKARSGHQQDDTLLDGLGDLASLGQLELVTPDIPNNF